MKLYIKSISLGALERSPGFFFHSCDLKERKSITFYPEQNKEAIEFLERRGISFDIVDLSKCSFGTALKAKMTGINKTPTLILDDGTKLKGMQQIKDHFTKDTPISKILE